MGYTTDFTGTVEIYPPLNTKQVAYIKRFNKTRRMGRGVGITGVADPIRKAVGLPCGRQGCYFVGNDDDRSHVIDINTPPSGQPGLCCGWTVSDDGKYLEWDGIEKFYDYTEWMQYLIDHFFIKWERTLNGKIRFQGEDVDDRGAIKVINNTVAKIMDTIIQA